MLEIFMNYATLWIVVGLIAAVLIFKQLSYISPEAARKYLQEGALVVDVRSVEEYRGEHLPMAMNIPLGDLQDSLPGAADFFPLKC